MFLSFSLQFPSIFLWLFFPRLWKFPFISLLCSFRFLFIFYSFPLRNHFTSFSCAFQFPFISLSSFLLACMIILAVLASDLGWLGWLAGWPGRLELTWLPWPVALACFSGSFIFPFNILSFFCFISYSCPLWAPFNSLSVSFHVPFISPSASFHLPLIVLSSPLKFSFHFPFWFLSFSFHVLCISFA